MPDSCAVCAGTKRKAMRAASPVRTAASWEERQAGQAAARSEAPGPASQDAIHSKDSPPAAKRQRHKQQVKMQSCAGSMHSPALHTCHARTCHTLSAQGAVCQVRYGLTLYK